MATSRWTLGCVALVSFTTGCSDAPGTVPKLHEKYDERGVLVPADELPDGPVTYGDSRVREPGGAQQVWLDEKNREFDRKRAALQESREEQDKLDRQRIELHKEVIRLQSASAYEDALRKKDEMLLKHQQSPERSNLLADRRRAKVRGMQERSQSDLIDQQKATGGFLSSENTRQQQEATQPSRPVFVPTPIPE